LITATYRYYADWDNDNSFGDPGEDISAYAFESSWEYGRDFASQLSGRSKAGSCRILLDNSDGRFSPFNVSSPLHGKMLPGRRVRVTMRIGAGAEIVTWQGYLESVSPIPGEVAGLATAELLAYGPLAHRCLQGRVSIPMHTDIETGAAVTEVLDAAGFPAADRAIDAGQGTMSRWWDSGTALQALRDLEETEAGFLRETKDGRVAFEDRAHRLSSPHTVPQASYGGGAPGDLFVWNPEQGDVARGIANHIEAEVRTFDVSEETVLWTLSGSPPAIAPGDTLTIKAQFPTPTSPSGYIAVSEWAMVDYEANSQADGLGTDLTEHVDAVSTKKATEQVLEFTNNGASTAYLVLCRCHGVAVVESDPVRVWAEDALSKSQYGEMPYSSLGRFLTNIAEAQDRCDHFLAIYKDPVPIVSFDLRANYDEAHLEEAQIRDVSDRISVSLGSPYGLFIEGDFFVEWVRHTVGRDRLHTVTMVCSAAVSHLWPASATPYEPRVIPPPATGESPHVPDLLWSAGLLSGSRIILAGMARKWNADVSEAEFRIKLVPAGSSVDYADLRTASEGGSFEHNGTTQLIVTGLAATWAGVHYQVFYGENTGRWYFAFRLKNAAGWSVWSDGNDEPRYVRDCVDTDGDNFSDTGPPEDWTVSVIAGPQAGTAVVVASRPKVNGKRIWFACFQVRDSRSGSWRAVDSAAGAAETYYDGSAIDHTYDPASGTITKASGDYGTAPSSPSAMILMDVRQGQFDERYTRWGGVAQAQFDGSTIRGCIGFDPAFAPGGDGRYTGLRIRIVKAPWSWNNAAPPNGDGYFDQAGYQGKGYWDNPTRGDVDSTSFSSDPFVLPAGIALTDIQATNRMKSAARRAGR